MCDAQQVDMKSPIETGTDQTAPKAQYATEFDENASPNVQQEDAAIVESSQSDLEVKTTPKAAKSTPKVLDPFEALLFGSESDDESEKSRGGMKKNLGRSDFVKYQSSSDSEAETETRPPVPKRKVSSGKTKPSEPAECAESEEMSSNSSPDSIFGAAMRPVPKKKVSGGKPNSDNEESSDESKSGGHQQAPLQRIKKVSCVEPKSAEHEQSSPESDKESDAEVAKRPVRKKKISSVNPKPTEEHEIEAAKPPVEKKRKISGGRPA